MGGNRKAKAWIDENGIHLPDFEDILSDLQQDYRDIYGPDIYLEPDSQDGAMCLAIARRIHDCYTLAASVYNSYSPATAQGAGLSSVVKTNGIFRKSASKSSVDLRLVGQAGTVINNGIAADEAGNRWLLPEKVTIPLSGEITVQALAEKIGDIRAAAGEICNISTPIRGWQTVNNLSPALVGRKVETDAALRIRQKQSTALPSLSIFEGICGAVASLPGVVRSIGYENDSDMTDANTLPPHSICFVVDGGNPVEIAETIAAKKSPGCKTHGDVFVDTRDKYGLPNRIFFYRPKYIETVVSIRIQPLLGYSSLIGEKIRQNVLAYMHSLKIGESVLLSKLYTPINAAEDDFSHRTFDIVSVELAKFSEAPAAKNLDIAFNALAISTAAHIKLQEL